jgi:hypothetical protein
MVSLRTQNDRRSGPLTAEPGHRWKAHLTSVCIPAQHLAAIFRATWSVDAGSKVTNGGISHRERYAERND